MYEQEVLPFWFVVVGQDIGEGFWFQLQMNGDSQANPA
jgi:hypothetical protein